MTFHKNLINPGKWYEMSLAEQLGNVGSDVDRIISWRKKGNEIKKQSQTIRKDIYVSNCKIIWKIFELWLYI